MVGCFETGTLFFLDTGLRKCGAQKQQDKTAELVDLVQQGSEPQSCTQKMQMIK